MVEAYTEAMARGDVFPAVIAFFEKAATVDGEDIGGDLWLGDGFQRLAAVKIANLPDILVDVRYGTREDAVWFAVGANQKHGARRTRADIQNAIKLALKHPRSAGLSDRKIAEHVGCDHKTVGTIRRASGEFPQSTIPAGDEQTTDTANIGKGGEPKSPPPTIAGEAVYIPPADPEPRVDLHNEPPSDADEEKMALQERVVSLHAQLEATRAELEAAKAAQAQPDGSGEPVERHFQADPFATGMALVEQARLLLLPLGWEVRVIKAELPTTALATPAAPTVETLDQVEADPHETKVEAPVSPPAIAEPEPIALTREQVRAALQDLKMTQRGMPKAAGIEYSAFSKWLCGRQKNLSAVENAKLAAFLNLRLSA